MYYYGARYYAPWLCRFVSVDPLAGKYSFYTPYQYAGNKPINFIDLDGLEEAQPVDGGGKTDNVNPQGGAETKSPNEYTTPGGDKVTFQEEHTAETDSSGERELTGGDKVTFPKGALTSFTVNGTKYRGFYNKQKDGSWSFGGYRDKEGNVYDNFKTKPQTSSSTEQGNQSAVKPSSPSETAGKNNSPEIVKKANDTNTGIGAATGILGGNYGLTADQPIKYGQRIGGKVRSAPLLSRASRMQSMRIAGVLGRINFVTGVLGTLYSMNQIRLDYNKGGWEQVKGTDISDAAIGTAGVLATGAVALGLMTNPVGLGIGIGIGLYFAVRLVYDLSR
jgi:hypothetical protein